MIRLTEEQIRWYRLRRSGLVEPFEGVLTAALTTAKRQRTVFYNTFIAAYEAEILSQFQPKLLLDALTDTAQTIAFFCVEREPTACHRSLVANKLAEVYQLEVAHLLPDV